MDRNEGKKQSQAEEMVYVKREDWERTRPVREAAGLHQIIHTVNMRKISLSSIKEDSECRALELTMMHP